MIFVFLTKIVYSFDMDRKIVERELFTSPRSVSGGSKGIFDLAYVHCEDFKYFLDHCLFIHILLCMRMYSTQWPSNAGWGL